MQDYLRNHKYIIHFSTTKSLIKDKTNIYQNNHTMFIWKYLIYKGIIIIRYIDTNIAKIRNKWLE